MEHAGPDPMQDLRHQPEQAHARRPVPLRPVPTELRLLRLRQHVEPQPRARLHFHEKTVRLTGLRQSAGDAYGGSDFLQRAGGCWQSLGHLGHVADEHARPAAAD